VKIQCPHCEGDVTVEDDPRLTQILEAMNTQQKTLDRFADKIEEKTGTRPNVPVTEVPGVTAHRKGPAYEGIFFTLDDE